jgi:PAS domain S-box-containing protein
VVLPLCLLATAVVALVFYWSTSARDQGRFLSGVDLTADAVTQRLRTYVALLRGGTGLFAAVGDPGPERFAAYVGRLQLTLSYPGIQGMGFARRVTAAERPHFQETPIFPPGEREDYFPIVYLQPMDRLNERAIGYDMFSEPVRREAMSRARDTGQAAASGKVRLVQEENADQKQAGFLVYTPVYRGGTSPETVDERRESLLGFVYSPFRADDLFRGMMGEEDDAHLHYRVYDGTDTGPAALLHDSGLTPSEHPSFETTRTIRIAGRPWTLAFATTPEFDVNSNRGMVWWVVGAGLVLSILLTGITSSLARARAAAEEAEEQASQQRERYRVTLASILDAVIASDPDGRTVFMNGSAEGLTGWSRNDAEGELLSNVLRLVHEESGAPLDDPMRRALTKLGGSARGEVALLVARNGAQIPVEHSAAPIRDSVGNLLGFVIVARDVSERKAAELELRRAQEQLQAHAHTLEKTVNERTARLRETIGELEAFSYSLSHDMRAPLRSILNFSQFVIHDFGDRLGEEGRDYIERAIASARRMDRLMNDVLAFTRLSRQHLEPEDVNLDRLTRGLIRERAELQPPAADVQIEGTLPTVRGHEASLTQCLSNLLSNAVKFVAPGVHPRVRIRGESLNGQFRVWIEDNGIGLNDHAKRKLFTLFERHHPGGAYEGTGLGLAIVRKAVERMHGQVGVESEPGKGSRFWFQLPAAQAGNP